MNFWAEPKETFVNHGLPHAWFSKRSLLLSFFFSPLSLPQRYNLFLRSTFGTQLPSANFTGTGHLQAGWLPSPYPTPMIAFQSGKRRTKKKGSKWMPRPSPLTLAEGDLQEAFNASSLLTSSNQASSSSPDTQQCAHFIFSTEICIKNVVKFPRWLSQLRIRCCLCERVGLIRGLTQWVKDPWAAA